MAGRKNEIPKRTFQIYCPKCKRRQLYEPKINKHISEIRGKSKKCVFCNRSFTVYKNICDNQIVKRV